jgi:hypothetical protein
MPPAPAAAQARLPFRSARDAPVFDGNPLHLLRYFKDLDHIYDALGLTPTDEEKIEAAIYYLDYATAMLWESLKDPAAPFTWATFKDAVGKLYPGSDGSHLYSVGDLETLVKDWSFRGIFTRSEFGEYHREFSRMAKDLVSKNKIDNIYTRKLYLAGFGEATRRRIEFRLGITHPNHRPDEPYETAWVEDAAEFLLAGRVSSSPSPASQSLPYGGLSSPVPPSAFPSSYPMLYPGHSAPSAPPPTPQVKQEPIDMQSLIATMVSEVIKQTASAQRTRSPTRTRDNNNNGNNSNARWNECVFCGTDGCRIAVCQLAQDYIAQGKCIKGPDGRLILPSGQSLPRGIPGKNLAERFDNFQKMMTPSVPKVTTAMFDTVQCAMVEEAESEEEEEEDEYIRVMANELRKEKAKKKVEVVMPKSKPAVKPGESKPAANASPSGPPTKTDPQFRYESPAESSELLSRVWERSLDSPVTLTQRELLAVSLDLRKKAKEFTSARKVPATANKTFLNMFSNLYEPEQQGLEVAVQSDPLRAIGCLLMDGKKKKYDVEAVLDNGSSIVAMRRDVWEKLSLPVRSDLRIDMESSHGTIERTVGVIENLPVGFGNVIMHLQVHVTDHLPCEFLLGRPFFRLASSTTYDHIDGAQEIVIRDPNTSQEVTIATHEKKRYARPQGF